MKRILFITKNFPPQKWWIENYSRDLYENLQEYFIVELIANKKGKYFLPFFCIFALIKGLVITKRVDIIYIWDGSLSFIWYILWKIFNKEIYITIHWLDITWKNKIYQKIIPNIIKKFDKIVVISNITKEICIEKGINENKIFLISNWLNIKKLPSFIQDINKEKFLEKYWISNINWKKILFTVWRFIKRKWIDDFLENVFLKLDKEKYLYIIWWFWKYEKTYKKIIKNNNLSNVFIVWKLDINEISVFESISNLFIMPNLKVEWDIEWFGISVIEAWYYWLPVIWSNIEWLKDSIINGKTWILIENDINRNNNWIKTINNFDYSKYDKKKLNREILMRFDWKEVINKYIQILN